MGEDIDEGILMSPSAGGNEYDNDPLGLGATVEYVQLQLSNLYVSHNEASVCATWTRRPVSSAVLSARERA